MPANSENDPQVLLGRILERTANTADAVKNLDAKVTGLTTEVTVLKTEFLPVKTLIWKAVGIILAAVLTAIVASVIVVNYIKK